MQSPELTAAIDALYDAFAGYARPATFRVCGCCFRGRKVPGETWGRTSRPLVEVVSPGSDLPLRDVAADDALADIGLNVPLTGGDMELFKHYLPRLLEVTVALGFEDDWPDLATITGHLVLTPELGVDPWWTWPEHERSAVQRFLELA